MNLQLKKYDVRVVLPLAHATFCLTTYEFFSMKLNHLNKILINILFIENFQDKSWI